MNRNRIVAASRNALCAAAALAGSLAVAVSAAAGDVAELDCPVAAITQAERRTLDRFAVDSRYGARRPVAILERVLDLCAARYQWDEAERDDALIYTRAAVGQAYFRGRLDGEDGLDLPALERAVAADEGLVGAAAERGDPQAELERFLVRSQPMFQGWLTRNDRNGGLLNALGGLFATTAIVEGSRIRFSRRAPSVPPGTI